MGRFVRLILLIVLILSLGSFSLTNSFFLQSEKVLDPVYKSDANHWVDSLMNTMTIEEKVGQLFFVAAYSNKDDKHTREIRKLIEKNKIGGLVFFQGGPLRQAELTNSYQELSEIPLFIAMDAEWGPGMRLDSVMDFPYQMTLGAIRNDQLIYDMGTDIAEMLAALGVHINFAPVVDINTNPDNPVINHRSFGEDKVQVTRKSYAYMKGLQDNRILAFAKHFPGHGNTNTDSHKALPVVNETRDELWKNELIPFQYLINHGLAGVMVAHLSVPSLDSTGTPTSLSKQVVDSLLRQQLGFDGLVITDALNMEGAKDESAKPGEIELKALMAGTDILLMSEDVPKAIKYILKAIKKGNLSESFINDRCRNILQAKYWCGLNQKKATSVDLNQINTVLKNEKSEVLNELLNAQSITLLKNNRDFLPLEGLDTSRIFLINIDGQESLFPVMVKQYADVTEMNLASDELEENMDELLNKIPDFNLVILFHGKLSQYASRNFGLNDHFLNLADTLPQLSNAIFAYAGNPYGLNRFKNLELYEAVLLGYNNNDFTQSYLAQGIFGGSRVSGLLPVSIGDLYEVGFGESLFKKTRLGYSQPGAVGLFYDSLRVIDKIVEHAINERATPGCQILIAKNGKVVWNKAYGNHTYKNRIPVRPDDIYDIASITKIAATLPVLMQWHEEGIINISDPLSKYLHDLDTSQLKGISMKDILGHQAALQAWIPFYRSTLEDSVFDVYYRKKKEEGFEVQVAEDLYIRNDYQDSVFFRITQENLREDNSYKYSDLGYYLFHMMIEQFTGRELEQYVDSVFYKPLGAKTLGYLPLKRFKEERIVPTEDDEEFRNQHLCGYVHDPGAAMLGGVGGHAGLFSNANDLAKLMQMYLNGGEYGGQQFLKQETINYFSSTPFLDNENRRGIGFDKPEMNFDKVGPTFQGISASSYGHTGFTGTMAWVDPEKEIVYIFLSNRICPDASNSKLIKMDIRTRIQEQIYKSIR